jgi:hypothetical protein
MEHDCCVQEWQYKRKNLNEMLEALSVANICSYILICKQGFVGQRTWNYYAQFSNISKPKSQEHVTSEFINEFADISSSRRSRRCCAFPTVHRHFLECNIILSNVQIRCDRGPCWLLKYVHQASRKHTCALCRGKCDNDTVCYLQIWRVAENIRVCNNQQRTATRDGPVAWGLGGSSQLIPAFYRMLHRTLELKEVFETIKLGKWTWNWELEIS